MKKELIELFTNNDMCLSFNNIKKFLGVSKKHMNDEVRKVLKELELEGILYEDKDSMFKSVPSNFFVTEINETKKGEKYFIYNGEKINLSTNNLNGALNYDKVLVAFENGKFKVKKIILRSFPNVVCEVVINKDNIKCLKPLNIYNDINIIVSTREMKKLILGEIVVVKTSENLYDDKFEGKIIKSLGYKTDPDIDYKTIAYTNGFKIDFSEEVLKELDDIKDEVSEEDIKNRVDLRGWTTFTIDGIDCKDMDDAVSIKKTKNGYLLGVHIAHVSHYIKPNSKLFSEALERTTSVYFPDSVIPMLPQKISNGICSLNEGVDRLTRSVLIEFDMEGNILNYRIFKSVINSNKKMDYESVQDIFDNKPIKEDYKPFVKDLLLMKELSEKLSIIKEQRGYIGFNKEELDFELDNLNNTKEINIKERISSEDLIENFMLVANNVVPLSIGDKPCVYRNHPYPSENRIKETVEELSMLGYKLQSMSNMKTSAMLKKLVNMFKDKEEFIILSNMILRSMKLAYYDTENVGHFGLQLESYSHFTSPIRRLPDLLLHTLLDIYDDRTLSDDEKEVLLKELKEATARSSKLERMADKAEYEVDKLQVINYIKQHIDEEVEVFIESISTKGVYVRSKGLMDGFISLEDFNDSVYLLPSGRLKSRITGRQYKVGHKLLVKIKDASYQDKMIYYTLVDNLTLTEADEKRLTRKLS